jgi:hypothetical protein
MTKKPIPVSANSQGRWTQNHNDPMESLSSFLSLSLSLSNRSVKTGGNTFTPVQA